MFWIYLATTGILLFLLVVRALTAGERPQRAKLPEHAVRRAPASAPPQTAAAAAGPVAPIERPVVPDEEEPAAASVAAAASPPADPVHRRKTPLAPKPIPVIFVQTEIAAAPPGFRMIDGSADPGDAPSETSIFGPATNGDHLATVHPLSDGRHASNGNIHGNGRANGHPTAEENVRPLSDGTRRGHAPRPHPKTRSPDRRPWWKALSPRA